MKNFINFQYGEQKVRTIVENGVVWFFAKDVCEILDISKDRDAVSRLDEDERGSVLLDLSLIHIYRVIMRKVASKVRVGVD